MRSLLIFSCLRIYEIPRKTVVDILWFIGIIMADIYDIMI